MKKPDELKLIELLKANSHPYDALTAYKLSKVLKMPEKRLYSILEKWVNKGLFEYGVTLRTGWVTPKFFD